MKHSDPATKKFKKIVLYDLEPVPTSEEFKLELKNMCKTFKVCWAKSDYTAALKKSDIAGADCLIVNVLEKYNGELLGGNGLKYLGLMYTALGDVDLTYLRMNKVAVTNASWYSREPVAEQTMGMLLNIAKNIGESIEFTRSGSYGFGSFKKTGWELKGKTLGVVGYGKIGSRVAELAEAFGMNVIYYSRHRKNVPYKFTPIDELLKKCDIVSVCMSSSEDNKHFFDRKRISMLKRNAVLLSISPGDLVDAGALYARCKKGDLFVGFDRLDDKMWREKLLKLDNFYLTPWNSTNSRDALHALEDEALDNAKSFLVGKQAGRV